MVYGASVVSMEVKVAGGRVDITAVLDSSSMEVLGTSSMEVKVAGGKVGMTMLLLSNVGKTYVVVSELVGSSVGSVTT